MEKLIVHGGKRLNGQVSIAAAKNAVLPILACCILSREQIVLHNCVGISDVDGMLNIIRSIGGTAKLEGSDITVNCRDANPHLLPADLTGGIRSSIFVLGPILGRFGYAQISYPGGCEIGLRPIDLHIHGLKRLGVDIIERDGMIICDAGEMRGGTVILDFPSVGATENLMMAGVLGDGETVIRNAAREPEITDLQNFINSLGGRVSGAGSGTVVVRGVDRLHGGQYTPIGDRIAAGTFLTACAMCGGEVSVTGVMPDHLYAVTEKLLACGAEIDESASGIRLRSCGKVRALHRLETQPFPGFPTDMQPQMTTLLSVASGSGFVVENMFENRFKYTAELVRMGAKIQVKDRVAMIKGVKRLRPTNLLAEDLRGGAALIIAALSAEGSSIIENIHHVDRGYYRIEQTLGQLGAEVARLGG